jgi:hypothetical protein
MVRTRYDLSSAARDRLYVIISRWLILQTGIASGRSYGPIPAVDTYQTLRLPTIVAAPYLAVPNRNVRQSSLQQVYAILVDIAATPVCGSRHWSRTSFPTLCPGCRLILRHRHVAGNSCKICMVRPLSSYRASLGHHPRL